MTRPDSPVSTIARVLGGATVAQQVWAKRVERKLAEPAEASYGLSKFGWFSALKNSLRN
jgi:hypothetical protein